MGLWKLLDALRSHPFDCAQGRLSRRERGWVTRRKAELKVWKIA